MSEPRQEPELLSADSVEDLLVADDRTTVDVYVPEWKKTVRLRQLTGAESIAITEVKGTGLFEIVSMSAVDANGSKLFKDPERLKGKSAGALKRIQDAALLLNGFTSNGNAAAAAKNA